MKQLLHTNAAKSRLVQNVEGYSIADLWHRWKVGPDKIRGFLRRGEMLGINVAANLSGKPQWRITAESVERFEQRRSSLPLPVPTRARRRSVERIDYYP